MAKKRTFESYVTELKKAIKDRTGEKPTVWQEMMIKTTARQMVHIDNLEEEIAHSDLTSVEIGSQGQQKTIANPLLTMRKEEMRTLRLYMADLGLTYSATPSKITESTKKGVEENDPMKTMLDTMGGI